MVRRRGRRRAGRRRDIVGRERVVSEVSDDDGDVEEGRRIWGGAIEIWGKVDLHYGRAALRRI